MGKRIARSTGTFLSVSLLLAGSSTDASATIINGDFETGDFTGWDLFTIDATLPAATGSLGTPTVVPFDTNGDLSLSNAAQFQVGQVPPGVIGGGDPRVGGGISQAFNSGAGLVSISISIASSSSGNNADGGLLELLLDGLVLDIVDFGNIAAGTIERDTLSGALVVSAGTHTLSITMLRGYGTSSSTPFQYLDDVVVNAPSPSVPEPTTLGLLGLGALALGAARRR